jgi:hypothetical protein
MCSTTTSKFDAKNAFLVFIVHNNKDDVTSNICVISFLATFKVCFHCLNNYNLIANLSFFLIIDAITNNKENKYSESLGLWTLSIIQNYK